MPQLSITLLFVNAGLSIVFIAGSLYEGFELVPAFLTLLFFLNALYIYKHNSSLRGLKPLLFVGNAILLGLTILYALFDIFSFVSFLVLIGCLNTWYIFYS